VTHNIKSRLSEGKRSAAYYCAALFENFIETAATTDKEPVLQILLQPGFLSLYIF
jgi:hypothetical protein